MEENLNLESNSMELDDVNTTITAENEASFKGTESDQPNSTSDGDNDSDSDDDDDDEEEDEAELTLQIQASEAELAQNPSNYEAHVQYIKLLRKMCLFDKLREAREAMNALFPLTPAMWQEWAKDEIILLHGSDELLPIEQLYERGVSDYLSVSLWCDYLSFVKEYDPTVKEGSESGQSKLRNLFDRALSVAGLHVTEGSRIWDAYLEFELAILQLIHESNNKEKEMPVQIQRVLAIFGRKLSVPLSDLESTRVAYETWKAEKADIIPSSSSDLDRISSKVATAYPNALEMYNARSQFEEQISRQDILETERLQNFMNYIKFEQSFDIPARVQILYERAISEFPISSDLWMDYTSYLDKTLKGAKIVRDVYSRAIKNCPWVGQLWVRYLLSLERCSATEIDISEVFERSLLCTFTSFQEYLDLFLTRIDGLRRRVALASEAEDVLNFALIRATFQRASEYLSPNLKGTYELLHFYSYWARLEVILGKDLDAARAVWESLLKISGVMLEVWKKYIEMEIELGDIKKARSIYARCYHKRFPETGSEDICNSWLRFEREFGSLEKLDEAVQKVTPRLEELKFYRLQQESTSVAGPMDQNQNSTKKREKRKPDSVGPTEQPVAKRQKEAAKNVKKEPVKANAQSKKSVESTKSAEGNFKDNAQAKKSVESSKPAECNAKANVTENKMERGVKDPRPSKTKLYTDQCTAFISNLSPTTNDQDLRDFFKDGGVVAVRILKDKFSGKSRGLAYVDFSDEEHLASAVAKNRQVLHGKKLNIAKSDPKQKRNTGQSLPPRHGTDRAGNRGSGSETKDSALDPEPQASAEDSVQLKGRNTFAVPRSLVRPLGSTSTKKKVEDGEEETPKSNDEFRKMFLKQ